MELTEPSESLGVSASDLKGTADIRRVALAQRLLLWAVLASFIGLLVPLGMLVTIPFQLYCVFRLAKAFGMSSGRATVWLLAMFIPVVSLICLLVLNARATRTLRNYGVKVGLMGARMADLPAA